MLSNNVNDWQQLFTLSVGRGSTSPLGEGSVGVPLPIFFSDFWAPKRRVLVHRGCKQLKNLNWLETSLSLGHWVACTDCWVLVTLAANVTYVNQLKCWTGEWISNTQREVLLSKQWTITKEWLNAKFYKNAFFKILIICKNFRIWNIQIQGLFKDLQRPTLFSRTFKGLNIFQNSRTFKDFSTTLWTLIWEYYIHNRNTLPRQTNQEYLLS